MSESKTEATEPQRVLFHYIKSPAFHTLHADGVIGGVTPRADLHLAFYVERLPLPNQTQHAIHEDGTLGPELRHLRVCKEGIVREMLVDITMDAITAEALHGWLGRHLEMLRKRLSDLEAVSTEKEGE